MKSALNSAHNFYSKYSCNIAILAETLTIPIFCNPIFGKQQFRRLGNVPLCPMGNNCQTSIRFTVLQQPMDPQMLLTLNVSSYVVKLLYFQLFVCHEIVQICKARAPALLIFFSITEWLMKTNYNIKMSIGAFLVFNRLNRLLV